jgi:tape measure domain-containing protein
MAQVIDQYAIRIGFQLNRAQMAAVQNAINGVVGGVNRVIPNVSRGISNIAATSRQSLAVLDAAVARTSKLGMDLSVRLSLPLAALGGYGIKAAAEIEQANLTLEAMVGDSALATKMQKELNAYATSTSFNIQNVLSNANRLLATGATKPEGLMEMVKLFGALSMGDNEKFDRIAYAFGQINAAGRLMGTEGRQLSEALVNIYPILAKMRGLGEGTVNSSTVAGFNFTPEEVRKAMTELAKTGPFFKIMEKRADSLSVALSGLVERFYIFSGAIGESIRRAINLDSILKGIGVWFERIQKRVERMTDSQKKLLVAVGLFLIAVGPLTYALSVWMRTGAALLRVMGGLKVAFMSIKAVSSSGGLFSFIMGSAGAKALLVVAAVAAILAGIFLIVDDILVWKAGGKSVFGYLFGEKRDWEWLRPLLDTMREVFQFAGKIAEKGVNAFKEGIKSSLPTYEEASKNGGMLKTRFKSKSAFVDALPILAAPLVFVAPEVAIPTIAGALIAKGLRNRGQGMKLQVPVVGLTPQAADSLARLGALNAPQNTYVKEFDIIQAGAGVE